MKLLKLICLLLAVCLFSACGVSNIGKQKEVESLLASARNSVVPDRRVGVFDVEPVIKGKQVLLKGVTTSMQGKSEASSLLRNAGWKVTDSIRLIPDASAEVPLYGVVNHSVVPMNTNPRFSAEMTTQALLGMPVRILEDNSWLRVQTPDDYIAWTVSGYIQQMNKDEFNNWITAPKIIFLSHYGYAYSNQDVLSEPVSDLVSGCMLRLEGDFGEFYKVSYPDGRSAFVLKKESKPVEEWLGDIHLSAESLIRTAHSLNGVPYLWGGTSSKGVDCSGFIKTITFLHGLILQRDASQQAYTGNPVDVSNGYGNLKPGDLLFFGDKASGNDQERVIHVGLYMGNLTFIHSINNVHTGSFDPNSPLYDEYNTSRFIRATRILGAVGSKGISTIQANPFYQPVK